MDERTRSMLGFLEKLTLRPAEVNATDADGLRSVGLSDRAIEDAIYVCMIFNVMDRLADALAFELLSPEATLRISSFLYRFGYR